MRVITEDGLERMREAAVRGRKTAKINLKRKIEEYLSNPNLCSCCGNALKFSMRTNKFCSHSCSAKFNNPLKKEKLYCLYCGGELTTKGSEKYCSKKCERAHKDNLNYDEARKKLERGLLDDENSRRWFRRISELKCSICGRAEWEGKEIPLVVDHIDGNHNNNFLSNLRMVCCNCDAQLPTYKSKNRGNGRIKRKVSLAL